MSKKILDALRQMDPGNDNHWTADGLPKMDTVHFFAGNDTTITRAQVTEAMPGFSRGNPAFPEEKPPATELKADEQPQPTQSGPLVQTVLGEVDKNGDLKADGSESDAYYQGEKGSFVIDDVKPPLETPEDPGLAKTQAQSWKQHLLAGIHNRETAQAAFDQAKDAHNQATEALSATQAELDRYIDEDTKQGGAEPLAVTLQGYFARQQAEREERGRRKAEFKNIPLKDILPKDSPIDSAMRRRTDRGTKRPNRL